MVKVANYSLLSSPFEPLNRILSNHITRVFWSWSLHSTFFFHLRMLTSSFETSSARNGTTSKPAKATEPKEAALVTKEWPVFSMAGEIVWLKKPRKNPRMQRIGVFLTLLRKEILQKRVYLPRWSKSKVDGIYIYIRTYPTRIQQRFMFMSFEPLQHLRKKRWDYGGFHENPHAVSKHSPASWAIRSPLHHSNILKPGFGWHKSNCCHRLTRLWDPLSWPTSSSYIIHFVFCLSVF